MSDAGTPARAAPDPPVTWTRFGRVLHGRVHRLDRQVPDHAWAAAAARVEPEDHVWICATAADTVVLARRLRTASLGHRHLPASVVVQVERSEGDAFVAFATFSARVTLARLGVPFGFTSEEEQSLRYLAGQVPPEQRAHLERARLALLRAQGRTSPMAA